MPRDPEKTKLAAIFATRMAELKVGADERLPPEVTAFMLRGDSLLKALRKWRGLTQIDLSKRSNLAQGYISDIERGSKAGTHDAILSIAKALDVDPAWVLPSGLKRDRT